MFLNKTYTRESLKLAFPVMLTQLGQVSVQLFDNIIVGNLLGANALAAVSLANSLFFSVFIFGIGISFAIPPLVSQAHSRQKHSRINDVFRHGFVLNLVVGVLLMLLLLGAIPLLEHLNQPKEIIPDTKAYLWVLVASILPFMMFQTLREVSEGLGFTIGVTKATVIANVLNIALNYVFIQGLFGISPMGVKGAALATLIARLFMLVFLYFVMRRHQTTSRYIKDFSLKLRLWKKNMFVKMLKIGLPTAFQMFFEVTAFAGAAFICGLVSARDIASHQIALSMASFTFNLCIGFSVASTVMVGRQFGKRNFSEVRAIGLNNLKITFIYMSICGIIFIAGREILPTFFTQKEDADVIELASKLLIIAALFQLSDGIQVTALGTLRGIQDVKIPSYITFIAYWIITIPLGYYLTVTAGLGAYGMWIALGLGLTVSAILLVIRFLKLTGKRIKSN
ncbi:MATE family efflux transporter [Bergeyella sp. RCAD1439]|uniref:MATE family efflux transporter n=1 Tax=Bergeyella anatis TaxID=3113737 RepID=UPI002E185B40|nr:MATE family efflux transporter [Bergeyella sp. RCAD1439]